MSFYVVKSQTGKEFTIFEKISSVVKDPETGEILAEPTGGKAKIYAKIVKKLD